MQSTSLNYLTEEQLAEYNRDGFVVARQLFSPEEVTEIRETFGKASELGPVAGMCDPKKEPTNDLLDRYPRMMHPHRQSQLPIGPLSTRVALDPRIGAILNDIYGEEAVCAQTMYYFKPPGTRGQSLHQDNYYLRVKPATCMAAWLAIDDADDENGGLVCVPGSHKLDIACPGKADLKVFWSEDMVAIPEGMQIVPTNLKAGDVLFFHGSVIHGSYPNKSATRFRRAFIGHYLPLASSVVSQWYKPLLTFRNEVAGEIGNAVGGGPCGEVPKGNH